MTVQRMVRFCSMQRQIILPYIIAWKQAIKKSYIHTFGRYYNVKESENGKIKDSICVSELQKATRINKY